MYSMAKWREEQPFNTVSEIKSIFLTLHMGMSFTTSRGKKSWAENVGSCSVIIYFISLLQK